jgi:hypothetical protein
VNFHGEQSLAVAEPGDEWHRERDVLQGDRRPDCASEPREITLAQFAEVDLPQLL